MGIRVGLNPYECDKLTPHELNLVILGHEDKQKEGLKNNIIQAFYSAYFNLKGQKGLSSKDLEDVLKNIDKKASKEMTDEELFNAIKSIHSKFGGG
jgi:hypothetical protein